MRSISLSLLLAASLFGATQSDAASRMKLGGLTSQPIGHAVFCEQFKGDCARISGNQEPQRLTQLRWNDLVDVNNIANVGVEPVTDQEFYGVEEHWTYPRSYGDCEDYVLLKRYMLIQRGWSAANLLITVVRQANGDGHAVLTVRTSNGDFVLDNLERDIKRWDKTPYRYVKRTASNHSGRWISIRDSRNQVARY
ncbi:transglutaminase-like cysteine peptidase [Pseudahrensia aquimaris]|uniref:Transglutaminase-like cysteine peptidase n=1 Tax=Pseudahrensia aquimaris TaxID=744461 RepID=A0ABW3FGQ6_9HYPH